MKRMERVCFAFEQVGTSEDFQEPPRSVTSITNHHHYHYYSLPKNFHLAWHHLPHHYHHPFTSFLFLLYLYNFSWVFTDGGKQIHQQLNSRAVLAINNAVFSRCTCIGYELPTFGEYMLVEGFCAPFRHRVGEYVWSGIYIFLYVYVYWI